jgi:hypothetical protein
MKHGIFYSALFITAILLISAASGLLLGERGQTRSSVPLVLHGKVYPDHGDTNTTFNFTVDYVDYDGDSPYYVQVCIDGITYNMTSTNKTLDNIENGEEFYFNSITSFSEGNHTFSFNTESIDGSFRTPRFGNYSFEVKENV